MKWLKFVILIALYFSSGSDCKPSEKMSTVDENSIRLPSHTRPINYDVELTLHIHNGTKTYSGKVNIKIAVDVATDVITLHNKGLDVSRVALTAMTNDELQNTIALDASKDFLLVNVERQLIVGAEYSLEIWFDGLISTGMSGFYTMQYSDIENGEIR
jgi:aminopeptidase N